MGSRSPYRYCPFDGTLLTAPVPGSSDEAPLCQQCKYKGYQNPAPGVGIFFHKARQILLGRRANDPAKGEWDVIGGFVKCDQTVEDTVRNEAKEETALTVEEFEYLGSLADTYDERGPSTLNLIFLASKFSGEEKPGDDITELEWFPLDALPELAFPHQAGAVRLLRDYLARKGR